MLSWIALMCLAGGPVMLIWLSLIDLKTLLLPNEHVLAFATLGLVFHLTTLARILAIPDIFLGGLAGFGSLYALRFVANRLCGRDTLGLGDVKLIGAAGLWLGPHMVMVAMAAGAVVSLVHGLAYATWRARRDKTRLNLNSLSLPAGPGFACGIVMAGAWMFRDFRPVLFWLPS